jgi:phosphohistidine swiveling domain-containing protein
MLRAVDLSYATSWLIEDGPPLGDAELVGQKFARQADLARAGFPVPPLVCVPATVFDLNLARITGHSAAPAAELEPAERAAALRRIVRAAGLPDGLHEQLLAAFDAVAGPEGLVAVRACAIGTEDSADDPYAGLTDSFLYVGRDRIAERVADCWASAFTSEGVAYRAAKGLDPLTTRVAVGIQRMVMGTRSLVAFTRDPRDGSERTVIAAAYGIGEGVVQEKADVDHFFVAPDGEISSALVTKRRAVGWDARRPSDGPVPLTVDDARATSAVLTPPQVREVAALAARVERHFGAPQDIEATITDDGRIHLVQARPAVVAARAPATESMIWDNNNVTESFPGVSTALTYSVARELYEVGFTDLYSRVGVPRAVLDQHGPLLRRMVGHLHGRVYYQLDVWYRLHGLIRCFRPLLSTWEQSLGLAPTTGTHESRLATAARFAEIAGRAARHPRRVRDFLRWWDGYHERLTAIDEMGADEAVAAYRALWTEVARRWGVTLVNGIFLFAATAVTHRLLDRWVPGAGSDVLNGMLCGGPDNRSAAALHSAVALAATAAETPGVRDALSSGMPAEPLWRQLTDDPAAAPFVRATREHLRRYGDRGLHDLKIESVTPRRQPWLVLDTVRAYLPRESARDGRAEGVRARADAASHLRRVCRYPVRRMVLRALFAAMRTLMRYREDTRFCRTQLFGDTRALLLRLGEHLAAAALLGRPADVLHLTVEEVLGAFDGTLPVGDLRQLAATRAAEHERWSAAPPLPARFTTDAGVPLGVALGRVRAAAAPDEGAGVGGDGVLHGLASSSGIVRGRALVVRSPTVTADECRGRILVAGETDPGWLYLMMAAEALVVERGTLLSHTAITGRLLGVPTVVAVPRATELIPDGSLIEVDGAAGTVRILAGDR